jgi:Sugar (and other) transporter
MWALFWDLLWSPLTTTNDTDTTTHHYLNHQKWRLMLSCGAILPMILIGLVVTIMPESPRWLLAKGRTDEARRVIAQLVVPHDTDHHDSAVQEFNRPFDVRNWLVNNRWWIMMLQRLLLRIPLIGAVAGGS